MNLVRDIISIENFIIEKKTEVDGETVYIRPIYLELIYLYPDITNRLAGEIAEQIALLKPELLYAIEASILPLAMLVSHFLGIPLSIIRKPRNFAHEADEPELFINDILSMKRSILLDDAIWSGFTMNHVFQLFKRRNLDYPQCYFIFDFFDFNNGGVKLDMEFSPLLQNRVSWMTYDRLLKHALHHEKITREAYDNTVKLFRNIS